MSLVKRKGSTRDPFDLMGDLQSELSRTVGRSLMRSPAWEKKFEPDVDVVEEKDRYMIRADVPGLKKEELDIKVEGRSLYLKGERKQEKETNDKNYYSCERFYGVFTRSIELPTDVKAEKVKATYNDGVLEIELPKTEGAKSKQVQVAIA